MSDITKQFIHDTVQRIISPMGLECQAEITEESRDGKTALMVSIKAPDHARFLIGKNGQNLQAFEHILRAIVFKNDPSTSLTLDVNNYKRSQALRVIEVARQAVSRVQSTRRAEALPPMSSYERRVVHMELASITDVATESVGQEPQRRIVIKPYF